MKKTLEEFFDEQILEHSRVLKKTKETTQQSFIKIVRLCVDIIRNGNKIIFFGNGGSASDSQHLATELCVRFSENRKPISAISLNTDTSVLTAIGNDLGFNHIFSRQIEALGKPNDLVVAISTSGKSKNIIAYSDEVISVPAKNTSRIQEMHILLGQMLCNAIESELNLAKFVETEKS